MLRQLSFAAVAAAGVSLAAPASAGLILLEDMREISAFATISTPRGTFTDGPRVASPSSPGAAFDESITAFVDDQGVANALATARQESSFSSQRIYVGNSAHLHLHNAAGTSSHALARSTVDIRFPVEAGTSLLISGISTGDGYAELRDSQGSVIFERGFLRRYFETAEELRLTTFSVTEQIYPSGPTQNGGATITVAVVPAPGTAVPLAAIGWAMRRRRRTDR